MTRGPLPGREPSQARRKLRNGKPLRRRRRPGLGAGERKGRGGRSPVCRRRRARFARRVPARRSARRRGAARPPGASERRRLSQDPARSTPTQPRCATCASPWATRSGPRRTFCRYGAIAPAGRRASTRPDRRRGGAAGPGSGPERPRIQPDGLRRGGRSGFGGRKVAALAFSAFPDAPAAAAEIFALWVFDIALAIRLRWPRPMPLIATKILDPSLRSPGAGAGQARPRLANAAAGAIALAAASALDLAADLPAARTP